MPHPESPWEDLLSHHLSMLGDTEESEPSPCFLCNINMASKSGLFFIYLFVFVFVPRHHTCVCDISTVMFVPSEHYLVIKQKVVIVSTTPMNAPFAS